MLDHVLLDMDGVLADFQGQALREYGYEKRGETVEGLVYAHPTGADLLYPFGEWNIPTVLGISNNSFWAHLHRADNFFERLGVLDGALDLLGCIRDSGVPFTICTSPSLDPRAATSKIKWMRRLLDNESFKDYMVGSQKWLMGYNRRHLLIDDAPKNCEQFRAKGGLAYLWPQPWNEAHGFRDVRLESVSKMLNTTPT